MNSPNKCQWCIGDPLYESYHDQEWGVPLSEEQRLFEFLTLETFQAGLSWITILRKRENFRAAFDQFDYTKIATLVGLSANVAQSSEVAKNVAMQAAAMNPIALNEDGVDAAVIEKEIEIAKDQLRQEGKPEETLDNIAKGKLKRFFKDNTLIHQAYIKDSKMSVSQYVTSEDKALNITDFARVALG